MHAPAPRPWSRPTPLPSKAAAGLCVVLFLALALFAIGSIVVPARDWVAQVPSKSPKVRTALEPVIQIYKHLDRWIDKATTQIAIGPAPPIWGSRCRTSARPYA